MHSIDTKISSVLHPNWFEKTKLTADEKPFVSDYQVVISRLTYQKMRLIFINVIRDEAKHGFSRYEGPINLPNPKTGKRYPVQTGVNVRQTAQVMVNHIGVRVTLGCSESGHIPVASYNRYVSGEVEILSDECHMDFTN